MMLQALLGQYNCFASDVDAKHMSEHGYGLHSSTDVTDYLLNHLVADGMLHPEHVPLQRIFAKGGLNHLGRDLSRATA